MIESLLSQRVLPSVLLRTAIHYQLRQRLAKEKQAYERSYGANKQALIQQLQHSAIALSTREANQQHYELPTDFFHMILGPHLKYSCCDFSNDQSLEAAELAMLKLYCQRAEISDGQRILDLGCGWGAFSLYVAQHYPQAKITAVTNSSTQQQYIESCALQHNYTNLEVIKADVNQLNLTGLYDRVVSIEMFEHVRNHESLLAKIATGLKPQGKLFVHYFCHHHYLYTFDQEDSWMARYFFQDGLMPSEDLLLFFQNDLKVEQRWRINGMHYAQTCQAWLDNLFRARKPIMTLFKSHYGSQAALRFRYWELFIRACQQLFAFRGGHEWFVCHYLMVKKK